MKLLYCVHCHDIVRLFPEKRTCRCGKSWGHYLEDMSTTVQVWPSLSLGIANPDFRTAQQAFLAAPERFTPELSLRSWINPVSEPDVTFVQGEPLPDGDVEAVTAAPKSDAASITDTAAGDDGDAVGT